VTKVLKVYQGSTGFNLWRASLDLFDGSRHIGTAVVNVVGPKGASEANLFAAAERSGRSWGALGDPSALYHHLHPYKFVGKSLELVCQVDGALEGCMRPLESAHLKQAFD
jgi:hypothetical protein